MTKVLNTDDPKKPGNMTAKQYLADQRARMKRVGNDGLHTIPEDVLAEAMRKAEEGSE